MDNCQRKLSELWKNCKILQLSPLGTVAIYQRLVVAGGGFFLLLDLGPGAAACGMGIEINTGYSCYLSAARRRFRSTQPFAIACRLKKIVNFVRPETVRSYSCPPWNCKILQLSQCQESTYSFHWQLAHWQLSPLTVVWSYSCLILQLSPLTVVWSYSCLIWQLISDSCLLTLQGCSWPNDQVTFPILFSSAKITS